MPNYFTLIFDIVGPVAPTTYNTVFNIIDFVDAQSGGSLLNVAITSQGDLEVSVDGAPLAPHAAALRVDYSTTPTKVAIAVHPGQIEVSSEVLGVTVYTGATEVDQTRTTSYYLYTSNGRQTSAGGTLSGVSITGTLCPYSPTVN